METCAFRAYSGHRKGDGILQVGDTGIEPVTSPVSGKRATAAPIARAGTWPDRGGDGIRTRVNGFAGRCLASRPPHRHGSPRSDASPTGPTERMTRFELATLTLAR